MREVRTQAGKNAYRWDYEELRYLTYALTQSKDFQEHLNLFLDLHTQKEISEIIRRIIIASYLLENKTYEEITFATGASTNTISKIQQKLLRSKSVLPTILERTGSLQKFIIKTGNKKSPIRRKLDRFLARATLGLTSLGDQ